jgi:hypothetical protein
MCGELEKDRARSGGDIPGFRLELLRISGPRPSVEPISSRIQVHRVTATRYCSAICGSSRTTQSALVFWTSVVRFSLKCIKLILRCNLHACYYESVSKSFRTGRLERELQMVQFSATKCSCIAILWASLVSFAAITFVLLLNECLLLWGYISLSIQSGNFWIPSYYWQALFEFYERTKLFSFRQLRVHICVHFRLLFSYL